MIDPPTPADRSLDDLTPAEVAALVRQSLRDAGLQNDPRKERMAAALLDALDAIDDFLCNCPCEPQCHSCRDALGYWCVVHDLAERIHGDLALTDASEAMKERFEQRFAARREGDDATDFPDTRAVP